jgi:site-specific DNA-methyltransferase (adenine-specific)
MGTLYYGDNLDILRRYLKDDTVDLVYLDPPFNSAQNYNAFFHEKDGTDAASQIRAFEDTWSWNEESQRVYQELTLQPGKVSEVMQAFRTFLGHNDMMAYLAMMAPRLVELRRVLKPSGSLYLHCDDVASHYLKILLDAIFGLENFQNDITWKRTTAHNDPKRYGRITDRILFYSKTPEKAFNRIAGEYSALPLQVRGWEGKVPRRESNGPALFPNAHGRVARRNAWAESAVALLVRGT